MSLRPGYDDDLRLAHVIADQVDSLTMSRFKALDLRVETKPDPPPCPTPTGRAEEIDPLASSPGPDRATRCTARRCADTGHGPRQWVVDPIDGTKNFVRGVPVWATLIALLDGGQAGARRGQRPGARPALVGGAGVRRVERASRSPPATRLHVSDVGRLEDASLSYSSLQRLGGARAASSTFLGLTRSRVAHPGVRRLLVARPGRRGRRRPLRASRSSRCTTWRRSCRSSPRPAGRFTSSGRARAVRRVGAGVERPAARGGAARSLDPLVEDRGRRGRAA